MAGNLKRTELFDSSESSYQSGIFDGDLPVVVVGSGPVGLRFVQSLRKRDSSIPVVFYGKEPWEPYNRVKLSSLLSGDVKYQDITQTLPLYDDQKLITRFNCGVKMIDTVAKFIVDEHGGYQPYSKLVLATGSQPHVPNIKGIHQKGVYTFRDMTDAQNLVARQVRTRKVVVVGGGLLGIEAARAMQRNNTEVTIVEHTPQLMGSQLDEKAAEILREYILSLGIKVRLNQPVKEVVSDEHGIVFIVLGDKSVIQCDTVIVSAGIKPNIDLARNAHLSVGRGIRVNDAMRTSDPDIYAIGECCEHRERIYGLVAPGYEQAEVAAHAICRGKSKYEGSTATTSLKVLDKNIFSMGQVNEQGYHPEIKELVYLNNEQGIYRKIVIKNSLLTGAIAIGNWREQGRIQSLIENKKRVMPWQLLRFNKTGNLLPDKEEADVRNWPASAVVCNCTGRTRAEITKAVLGGCNSLDKVALETGASSVCGSCKPLVQTLIGSEEKITPVRLFKTTGIFSLLVLLLFAIFLISGSMDYLTSAETAFKYDQLWRDGTLKQITGFTVLGLSALVILLSLRKRIKKISWGNFDLWRAFHIFVSIVAVAGLVAHTGMRMGNNLDFYLMLMFVAMLIVGSISAITISLAHKFDAITMIRVRKKLVWAHILLFWPVPVLLTFHVFKSYYF